MREAQRQKKHGVEAPPVEVDATLRVRGQERIFALGDGAAVRRWAR